MTDTAATSADQTSVDYSTLVYADAYAPGILGKTSIAGADVGLGMTTRGFHDALNVALGVGLGIVGLIMLLNSTPLGKGVRQTAAAATKIATVIP